MSDGAVHILLVEDHAGDIKLTRRALTGLPLVTDLHVAVDGHEAMEFLQRQGRFSDAPRPKLILLDLNMPRMDGRQVLREVRSDQCLCSVPVIVLTTSDADNDILTAYQCGANSYHVKPVTFEAFAHLLAIILDYWLNHARTPS